MKKLLLLLSVFCLTATIPVDNFITQLSQKMQEYYKANPTQQAVLVFNQEKYAPSDTAFFQAYLFNSEMESIQEKRILTLGMFDSNGVAIQKINFSVFTGQVNNQIVIPSTAKPGSYKFIIYPLGSQNPAPILFTKEISIVGKNRLSYKSQNLPSELNIHFEGGHFISGVENQMILKSAKACSGKVVTNSNQQVAQFTIGKDRITRVPLIPQNGESYFIVLDYNTDRQPLPAATDGCAIRVDLPDANQARKIFIQLPKSSSFKEKELYLLITNGSKIQFYVPVTVDENSTFQIVVPAKSLKNGICQASILDNKGVALATRQFLTNNISIEASSQLLTKRIISQRENITIELTVKDKTGYPVQGNFSVVAFQKGFSSPHGIVSFRDEVFLGNLSSALTEFIDSHSYTADEKALIIDNLLVTIDQSIIPWPSIMNNSFKQTKPSGNIQLNGRALFKASKKPVPDSTLIVGYLHHAMVGYETYTFKDGHFELPFLYDFFGDDKLFYTMEYRKKEMSEAFEILPQNQEIKFVPGRLTSETDSIDLYGEFVFKNKLVHQSYDYFTLTNKKQEKRLTLNEQFEDEATDADFTVNVQDYISFPTMEDLIREVVPFLQHRKKNSGVSIKLLIKQKTNYALPKGEPLFLIDGVLTKNKDYFLNLKPIDVVTIKLINDANKLNRFGTLGKNGIVLVETKKPAPATVIETSTILSISGLNKPLSKQSFEKQPTSLRLPDLRSSLYWIPQIALEDDRKSSITFSASDQIGEFEIQIKGITKQGEPFEARASFEVVYNK